MIHLKFNKYDSGVIQKTLCIMRKSPNRMRRLIEHKV